MYFGGSAWALAHFGGGKIVHLFDTFEGMPTSKVSPGDWHRAGEFADAGDGPAIELQKNYPHVRIWKGIFPESAAGFDSRLSFVHLDADLYQSTMDGLNLFYPLLNPGGVILLDDYASLGCPGVHVAVRNFFESIGEDNEITLFQKTNQATICKPKLESKSQ